MSHEQTFMQMDKQGILETAVGIARLRFRCRDFQGASDALDNACDELHVRHFDACIADGYSVEIVEHFLGPRDKKVKRVEFT